MSLQLPSIEQAEAYLEEASRMNPGAWVAHSRQAAHAAQIIATAHPHLNPQAAYILALLHDIGRREGVHGMRHVMDGYSFLLQQGYPDAARGCLTHSYPMPNSRSSVGGWDGTPEDLDFLNRFLANVSYNAYDRLLQICDCVALPAGFCLMETRFVDVALRYGVNEFTVPRWKSFLAVKEQFEQEIGGSIYRLLPGLVEGALA